MDRIYSALCRSVGFVCVFAVFSLGLFIYARSLFMEKSPIQKHNPSKSAGVYRKGTILVIDGVRADAVHKVERAKQTKYHNNLSVLNEIPSKNVFKAVSIADLPTGTAMRILSIFSGIPTTLLSAQRSFKNQSCNVDNFISQLQRDNRSFLFYGDETWTYLFPEISKNLGEVYHPYGLIPFLEEKRIIQQAMAAQETNDFVIVHLISPDSYGHVYGTDSKEVQTALKIINDFLSALYNRLDEDSFIAVLSDHGVNDDGSHGGTSLKEKAASFIFIAKNLDRDMNGRAVGHAPSEMDGADPNVSAKPSAQVSPLFNRSNTHHPFYSLYKDELNQLHITEEINVISQNDILPTLCKLVGLGVPYNSSGIIIPEIVPQNVQKDVYAQEIERQKESLLLLEKGEIQQEDSKNDIYRMNVLLGNKIHSHFHCSSPGGMCFGICLIVLGVLLHLFTLRIDFHLISLSISVFCIVMVGHSVFSVIHEDVISLLACFLLGLSICFYWPVVLLPVITLLAGEFPLHSVDRFGFIRWIKKIPTRWECPSAERALFLCSVVCLVGYSVFSGKIKGRPYLKDSGSVLFAVSQFFSSGAGSFSRSVLMLLSPSLLPVLLYGPLSGAGFLYVFYPTVTAAVSCIDNSTQLGCFLFFLVKIMFFVTGHNHALSSINWEAAFILTQKTIPFVSGLFILADLSLPFLCVAYALREHGLQPLHVVVLLQAVCVAFGCIVNFWFLGQSLMWFIFTGRTVFECFFLVLFSLTHAIICIYKTPYKKIDVSEPYFSLKNISSGLDSKSRISKGK